MMANGTCGIDFEIIGASGIRGMLAENDLGGW